MTGAAPRSQDSRARADQLRHEQAVLEEEVAALREQVEQLEAARERLRQVAVVRVGTRRALTALVLLVLAGGGAASVGLATRHTTIVACARPDAVEPWAMGLELEKLARMLDHRPGSAVEGPGPCVRLPLGRTLDLHERHTVTAQLQRLVKARLPAAKPRFSLEVTERREAILAAIRQEPGDPRVYPLKPTLHRGGTMIHSYDRPGKDLCVWRVPIRATLPRLWYPRDLLDRGPKAKNLPFDQIPVALHHVSTDAPYYRSLVGRMQLYQHPPYNSDPPGTAPHSALEIILESRKGENPGALLPEWPGCERLVLKESDVFFAGLAFPVLADKLATFRFERDPF